MFGFAITSRCVSVIMERHNYETLFLRFIPGLKTYVSRHTDSRDVTWLSLLYLVHFQFVQYPRRGQYSISANGQPVFQTEYSMRKALGRASSDTLLRNRQDLISESSHPLSDGGNYVDAISRCDMGVCPASVSNEQNLLRLVDRLGLYSYTMFNCDRSPKA